VPRRSGYSPRREQTKEESTMNNPIQTGINRIIKQTDYQFTMIPNQAVRDPEITSNAFRLLSYLLSHENGYELVYDQIMRQTDLGKYAIQKAMTLLIQKGFLRLERQRRKDGSYGGYNYILLDPYKLTKADEPKAGASTLESFHDGTTSPLKEDKDTKKITSKEEHPQEGWEDFWKAYPRGEGKAQAREAYKKALKKVSSAYLLERLKLYIAHNKKNDIKFAHAATWLNQERWEDEYEAPSGSVWDTEYWEKRDREEEQRRREYEEMARNAAPPPKCKHDKTLALCGICLKDL